MLISKLVSILFQIHLMCGVLLGELVKKKIKFKFFFLHKKYQSRPRFARVGGIPETRVLFCLAYNPYFIQFIIIIPHMTTNQQVCGPKKILYNNTIINFTPITISPTEPKTTLYRAGCCSRSHRAASANRAKAGHRQTFNKCSTAMLRSAI